VSLMLRDHFESLKLLKDFDGPMVLLAAHEDDLAPRAEASQALEQYFHARTTDQTHPSDRRTVFQTTGAWHRQ
jgi:hypothetical protein